MRILLVSDQYQGSQHSAVEGIFGGQLKSLAEVTIVYFSREAKQPVREDSRVIMPHASRRRNFLALLNDGVDLEKIDVVIVRNFFPVLKQLLTARGRYGFRLGFWESFPHSYRRLHEARHERRAVMRKSVEYAIKRRREAKLLRACDFYLPITDTFKRQFRPDLNIPYLPLPLGIDFSTLPPHSKMATSGPIRFVYTGTIDRLRRVDEIIAAFHAVKDDYVLDIYTASENEIVEGIRSLNDPRIQLHAPLPREQLFEAMDGAHVGIGLIPDNPLYRVASPTKTLEYGALGMAALVNDLPEYLSLFDEASAFICPFDSTHMQATVTQIIRTPLAEIKAKGERARAVVLQQRAYKTLSQKLFQFLNR